jgi:hypothetical protein
MFYKLRGLGAVLVVGLAMSILGASTAQAIEFHSSAEHTILSGAQSENLSFSAGEGYGNVTCSTVDFSGTTSSTTETEWILKPTFSNCKDSFGRTVHWFLACPELWIGSLAAGPVAQVAVGVFCIGTAAWMLYTTSGEATVCTVEIKGQSELKPVSLANESGKVRVKFEINNLKSTTSGGFFNCGIANGEHTAGRLTGSAVLSGADTSGNSASLSVE